MSGEEDVLKVVHWCFGEQLKSVVRLIWLPFKNMMDSLSTFGTVFSIIFGSKQRKFYLSASWKAVFNIQSE